MATVNGFDPVPYVIDGDGIAENGPEVFRLGAFAGTNGAEGIIRPGDLRVHQSGGGTTQAQIDPGAAALPMATDSQSYLLRANAFSLVDVPASTSVARTHLVLARITDPQYPPFTNVPKTADGPYNEPFLYQDVDPAVEFASELNLGYPAIALARIVLPAGQSVVLDGHITSLRRLAMPRQSVRTQTKRAGALQSIYNATWFRAGSFTPTFETPKWATHLQVIATLTSIEHKQGQAVGSYRISYGDANGVLVSDAEIYDMEGLAVDRDTHIVIGEFAIPTQYRGRRNTQIGVDITRNTDAAFPGSLTVMPESKIAIQAVFEERAA